MDIFAIQASRKNHRKKKSMAVHRPGQVYEKGVEWRASRVIIAVGHEASR
jgi:hypothetical protein